MAKTLVPVFLFALIDCAHPEAEPKAAPSVTEASAQPRETTRVAVEDSITRACDIEASRTYFELDPVALSTHDEALERVADCLANGKLKGRRVRLIGYSALQATGQYTKEGKKRADSVASFLEERGVEAAKIIETERDQAAAGRSPYSYERRVDVDLED
jgi:outer membrane protein OmpA-like peptidoglycan-associated protein